MAWIAVGAAIVAAGALVLPWVDPGLYPSRIPAPPRSLVLSQELSTSPDRVCTLAYRGGCYAWQTVAVAFGNFSVPGPTGDLALLNVSYAMNRTCPDCVFEVFQGNFSATTSLFGPGLLGALPINGTGAGDLFLRGGGFHLAVWSAVEPFTILLTIVFVGSLLVGTPQ